ncbi:MAG: hypothetical protein EP297_14355 [Gammaproteobacteria bacterium]|nr:MAG: hypothetical protein EP297_14355 [Gammaproteobacteria bacterium]
MRMNTYIWVLIVALLSLGGCATQDSHVLAGGSAVELRSYQTRAFDTTDMRKMMRTTIAVLQDLGFIIDKTDEDLGMITGTKLSGYQIRMTVIVRPRGEKQLAVRASAIYNNEPIEDPMPYQDFFTALEKGIFLTAQDID